MLVFRPRGLFSGRSPKDLTMVVARDLLASARLRAVAAAAPGLPAWLVSLATMAFANALVALGLIILLRAGLCRSARAVYASAPTRRR